MYHNDIFCTYKSYIIYIIRISRLLLVVVTFISSVITIIYYYSKRFILFIHTVFQRDQYNYGKRYYYRRYFDFKNRNGTIRYHLRSILLNFYRK